MNLVMTLTIFYMLIVINAAVKSFVEFYSCICYNISIDLENKDICLLGRHNLYVWREVDFMANILPVSDLRNYNEVLKNCHVGEPVFLTKNGRGRFVVMDIEDYERDKAEKKLLMKLHEAEEAVKEENNWLTLEQLKEAMGV